VAGVGEFETRSEWWVRVTGDFNLAGASVFLSPPPGFPPLPSLAPSVSHPEIEGFSTAAIPSPIRVTP
jgi:hypothetical protein